MQLFVGVVVMLAGTATGRLVTFDNTKPRLDVHGDIINAHDGTTQRFGGQGATGNSSLSPFYYHAMGYPACPEPGQIHGCPSGPCGLYNHNNSVAVWSSPDLSSGSWELLETVFPSATSGFPACTYFRSQSVYNQRTRQYVLWVNVAGCAAGVVSKAYATATAPAPGGPFTFQGFVQPAPSTLGPINNMSGIGDFALFVDDDGAAYNILTHGIDGPGHRDMYLFALSDDYLSFEGPGGALLPSTLLPGQHLVEAPALFKRGQTYYALLGGCTCMGLHGGGVNLLTALHPLGPWTNMTASLDPGCPMFKQSTCFEVGPGAACNPVTQAQQNYVITVPLASGGNAYVWTGDKWQQSPNGMYDQQPQTWVLLEFDGDTLLPLRYADTFTLDVAVAVPERRRRSAALVAAAPTGAVETTCDLAGTWITGYAPNFAGGAEPATPAPAHSRLEVIAAVTPFGSPPAQYVTDAFGVSALALHPNWQTCLGNGTCSADQFGNARALNAGAPPCSFIEWPALAPHGGGSWCKAPFCTPPAPTPAPTPPSPQPVYPKFNVTWEPTYDMSRSTITNPNGSPLGPDNKAALKVDSSFGIIAFDGGDMACENYRLGPPEDPCKYAKTWTSL
jgi:hypothetical protein